MADLPQSNLQSKIEKLHREGEERAAQRLAEKIGYPYADVAKLPVSLEAVRLIPEEDAHAAQVAAVELKGRDVALVALDPTSDGVKKIITDLAAKQYDAKVVVASKGGLAAAWHFYQFVKPAADTITGLVKIAKDHMESLRKKLTTIDAVQKEIQAQDLTRVSPATLIEIILAGAMGVGASDIHAEAEQKHAKIRFRVDGLLHDVFDELPVLAYHALVSRIKLLSGMKINVSSEPQDGRFTISFSGEEIEIRVSIVPAEFGETVVMRILDPKATLVGLLDLGLREDNLAVVKKHIAEPNGLIMNTGPTGSGKTTTLYAFLRTINNPEMKIVTLEDPIEYRIEGIEQTQVNEEAGYTFANGLRAIVRQDPDVILVGEVRDLETGDIAVEAALTGHLVLSTLHANDAPGAVPRLINLGVKAVSIGPALSLIIAQRLVRKLCPHCKKTAPLDEATQANIKKLLDTLPKKVDQSKYQNPTLYEAVGCAECSMIGYKGRVGIFEFLEGGPDLEQTILKEASEIALREVAKRQEMVTMQTDGILKVLLGETTLTEVVNVTGEIVW